MRDVLEFGYVSLNKAGESLCGDKVESCYLDGHTTVVLADGLGSGVKANILSTLTSKILCTMISNGIPLEECVHTIIKTLPVCKIRGVAYSTFSIVYLDDDGKGRLIEFDNPQAIYLRQGKRLELAREKQEILGKTIFVTPLAMQQDDVLFVYSDGTIHAGIGLSLNLGWVRESIEDFLEATYQTGLSARCLAALIGEATLNLYGGKPGDDTTITAIRYREPLSVNLMIGPPVSPQLDRTVCERFFGQEGLHVVCGGTTCQIVSRYLDRPIDTSIDYIDPEIPPTASIEGVDLVTEGVITFRKLLELSEVYKSPKDTRAKYFVKRDGASKLADLLLEKATTVRFFVGKAGNAAHADLPINLTMKLKLVEQMQQNLLAMGKTVEVYYN